MSKWVKENLVPIITARKKTQKYDCTDNNIKWEKKWSSIILYDVFQTLPEISLKL